MNLLWLFTDFLSIFSKGLLRNWSGIELIFSQNWVRISLILIGFYYDFVLNFYLKFHSIFIDFLSNIGQFHCEFWGPNPNPLFQMLSHFLVGNWPIIINFHSIFEVSTQIHYFYFCPTFHQFSWILSGFGFKFNFISILIRFGFKMDLIWFSWDFRDFFTNWSRIEFKLVFIKLCVLKIEIIKQGYRYWNWVKSEITHLHLRILKL